MKVRALGRTSKLTGATPSPFRRDRSTSEYRNPADGTLRGALEASLGSDFPCPSGYFDPIACAEFALDIYEMRFDISVASPAREKPQRVDTEDQQ